MGFQRLDLTFEVKGEILQAWLYLPMGVKKPPVVVMAHGFGALRNFGLQPFAENFAARGLASLVFDYRCFGQSGGKPRQLVSIGGQLADWRSAVNFVRGLDQVDGERIALWGSSFSGGHVVVTAARDQGVRAVVSQVPHVDGMASARRLGLGFIAKGAVDGLKDLGRAALGRKPHYAPIAGPPDSRAFLRTPDCQEGYMAIVNDDAPWTNAFPARTFLWVANYRPTASAPLVKCPLLVVAGRGDSLIPYDAVVKMAQKAPRGEIIKLDCGHFDPYVEPLFPMVVKAEADFLVRHLLN